MRILRSSRFALALIVLGLILSGGRSRAADGPADPARFRRPGAMTISADGSRLFVANQRTGSLSIVDLKAGRVEAEHELGKTLVDLALLPDGRIMGLDRAGDALIVARLGERGLAIEGRIAVDAEPVKILAAPDGSRVVVASTIGRRLSVIEWGNEPAKAAIKAIDLPFPPLLMSWLVPGSVLVAADASGGRIGVVDLAKGLPVRVGSIPAHNIRGLTRSPGGSSLLVAHQSLSKLARSTFEDVHWGSFVSNHLRILPVESLLKLDGEILEGSKLIDLGGTDQAAGDPGAIAFDAKGRLAVALSGVHEIGLLNDARSSSMRRVEVGGRPTSVVASLDGALVYVADELDDTISVVDVTTATRIQTIALGVRPEPGAVERGERLFFDAKLSHDGWMSCQSCHTDGRENGQVADTLTDGGFGAPKRVSSLLGVGSTGPWGWLGTTETLEDQVRKSFETTMRGRSPTDAQVNDLTAYLRSLAPPQVGINPNDAGAVARGREIFQGRKCAECHVPPEYTTAGRFDVGLTDEAGNRRFNPPSLRGVGSRPPYFHDGRSAILPDVFLKHRHPRTSDWSTAEVDDLVAFLKTL